MIRTYQRWVGRLLNFRTVRRPPATVGACGICGVRFAGKTEQWSGVEQVLRAHESICPGGDRGDETVVPFPSDPDPEHERAMVPLSSLTLALRT